MWVQGIGLLGLRGDVGQLGIEGLIQAVLKQSKQVPYMLWSGALHLPQPPYYPLGLSRNWQTSPDHPQATLTVRSHAGLYRKLVGEPIILPSGGAIGYKVSKGACSGDTVGSWKNVEPSRDFLKCKELFWTTHIARTFAKTQIIKPTTSTRETGQTLPSHPKLPIPTSYPQSPTP